MVKVKVSILLIIIIIITTTSSSSSSGIIYYKNLSILINYDSYSSASASASHQDYLVRKIETKYGQHTDMALIQYLNSQLDEHFSPFYHLINSISSKHVIRQYNFTLCFNIELINVKFLDDFNEENKTRLFCEKNFIQKFLRLYQLNGYYKNHEIQLLGDTFNLQILIRFVFKETNIEALNTRLKYLLLIVETLFTSDGVRLFRLDAEDEDDWMRVEKMELTNTDEQAFCMGIHRQEFDRFIYPLQKLMNSNLIIENEYSLLRLNGYNKLWPLNNQEGQAYQFKILMDGTSLKEVDVKLCQEIAASNDLDYDYDMSDMKTSSSEEIYIDMHKKLFCNLTNSNLYFLHDRQILIGLHLNRHNLYFTPYGQNGTFLSINCTSCQQIGYRAYLICLSKADSIEHESALMDLNKEAIRWFQKKRIEVDDHSSVTSTATLNSKINGGVGLFLIYLNKLFHF